MLEEKIGWKPEGEWVTLRVQEARTKTVVLGGGHHGGTGQDPIK